MTYLVTDECINCKYQDCIEVCPIDCFYEGENTIVINTEIKDKVNIEADLASKSAIEKLEKISGSIQLKK